VPAGRPIGGASEDVKAFAYAISDVLEGGRTEAAVGANAEGRRVRSLH